MDRALSSVEVLPPSMILNAEETRSLLSCATSAILSLFANCRSTNRAPVLNLAAILLIAVADLWIPCSVCDMHQTSERNTVRVYEVLSKGVDRMRQAYPAVCCYGPLMNTSSMLASGSCRRNDPFSTVPALITTIMAITSGGSLIIVLR